MEKRVLFSIFAIILAFSGLSACAGFPEGRARTASGPLFTGSGGRGLVIAVPAPSMPGGGQANSWMPQLFQDIITSDLARYSAMTVLDRLNESLVLAEQRISASGNYSDDDYIAMGRLTNAKFIAAGNIIGVPGRYSISFRINNTETNEIQASFSKQYVLEDIESGLAAKEAALALLTGMGVELTDEGKRQLLTIQEKAVKSQIRLAQGMAAERNNNELQALVFFQEALNADQGMKEASQRIQSFGQGSPGAGIRERAEWAVTQKTRWEKIFNDLRAYAEKELWIVVYDFSTISDEFDAGRNTVTVTFNPGIKIIPNRTVLAVWKNVTEEYLRLRAIDENKQWISAVHPVNILGDRFPMLVNAGLYDEYNDLIGSTTWIQSSSPRPRFQTFFEEFPQGITRMQVIAQHKYFTDYAFGPVSFRVPVKKITDDIKVQIEKVHNDGFGRRYNAKIMSLAEWNEWLKNQ